MDEKRGERIGRKDERLRVREKQSNQKQSNDGTAAARVSWGGGREVRLASPTVGIKRKG